MKRKMTVIMLVAVLMTILAACGDAPSQEGVDSATPTPPPATENPVETENDPIEDESNSEEENQQEQQPSVLRVAAGRSFWHGPAANIYLHNNTNVWEPLAMFDNDMEPFMKLADSFEPSEDGLTWTVTLREGITFHDRSAFNAEVAAFNLERLYRFNPATGAYDPEFARVGEYGMIEDISVVSEYVFTVTHSSPMPDFVARVSMSNSAMFAMSSFDEDKAFIHPYGTGPFMYVEHDEANQILTLAKFTDYRLGEPNIDTILFFNIPDAVTRLAALQNDEIDAIADVGGLMPQQAATVISNPNLQLRERQVSTIHYIAMNSNEGSLFSDVRLRNALSFSVDRETIVDVLLLGYGAPAISVVTDLSSEWVVDGDYQFDPDEASRLISEATDGNVPEAVFLVNSAWTGRWPYQDVAVMLQSQLSQIGINVTIETVDAPTWNERARNSEYDITIHPATITSGEPSFFFIRVVESGGPDNVSRGYGISNPELDALIARATTEPDIAVRRNIVEELQLRVREADYIIPAWYDVTLYAVNNRVNNFELDVQFWPNLFVVSIEN